MHGIISIMLFGVNETSAQYVLLFLDMAMLLIHTYIHTLRKLHIVQNQIFPCFSPHNPRIHQTDAQHLKISASADRTRRKWELRMQDSHALEVRGSWEKRQDLGGSIFYHCATEEGLPEPFRCVCVCFARKSRA